VPQAWQPVDRWNIVARDTVLCFREGWGLEMRKTILTLSLTEIKQNSETILKTHELFIMETYVNFLIGV